MFDLELLDKSKETDSILELVFKKPNGFSYQPGQFMTLELGEGKRRFYSLASHPDDQHLKFLVELVPNGAASQLFQTANLGQTFSWSGPLGYFTPHQTSQSIVMICTGTGVAPFLAHLKEYAKYNSSKPIELWFGVANESSIFKEQKLKEYKHKIPQFSYTICLSRPKDEIFGEWRTARVTDLLKEKVVEYKDHGFYLCGHPEMVKDCLKIMEENNVSPANIYQEYFTPAPR